MPNPNYTVTDSRYQTYDKINTIHEPVHDCVIQINDVRLDNEGDIDDKYNWKMLAVYCMSKLTMLNILYITNATVIYFF